MHSVHGSASESDQVRLTSIFYLLYCFASICVCAIHSIPSSIHPSKFYSTIHSFIHCVAKMEAAEIEAGVKNHLQEVLSESEFSVLPNQVANKINVFIDKKFEDYLTSTALHETSKFQNGKPGARRFLIIIYNRSCKR